MTSPADRADRIPSDRLEPAGASDWRRIANALATRIALHDPEAAGAFRAMAVETGRPIFEQAAWLIEDVQRSITPIVGMR
jgi:hypothetical protein